MLEPDPGSDATIGHIVVGLEQAPIGFQGVEPVVLVGGVRRERGSDADLFGGVGRPFHEPPHVQHTGGAGPESFRVGHPRRSFGDLRSERPMRRINVLFEPLPQRQSLSSAPQQT